MWLVWPYAESARSLCSYRKESIIKRRICESVYVGNKFRLCWSHKINSDSYSQELQECYITDVWLRGFTKTDSKLVDNSPKKALRTTIQIYRSASETLVKKLELLGWVSKTNSGVFMNVHPAQCMELLSEHVPTSKTRLHIRGAETVAKLLFNYVKPRW